MQSINLNLVPGSFQQVFNCSQGDIGRQLTAKLFDGSTAYEIPAGSTVKIKATKPSGFGFDESATFSGSTVTITTAETMTNEWGRFPAELVITKDGNVIGTANFLFNIEKNPHPPTTVDGDAEEVIPELTLLVERVEAAASSVLDMEVVATTLPAGSQASYSYDEDLNKATFGIPQGEAGAGAAGVVASAYSSSKTYKVGDYVIHNSNLYRCITAITTAEAFTAAHWTQIVLADDVSDLKTDFNDITEVKYGKNRFNINAPLTQGYYNSNGEIVGTTSAWRTTDYCYVKGFEQIYCSGLASDGVTRNSATMFFLCTFDENKQFIEKIGDMPSNPVSLGSNVAYVRFSFNGTPSPTTKEMLEEGSTITAYEPYHVETVLKTDNELTNAKLPANAKAVGDALKNIEDVREFEAVTLEMTEGKLLNASTGAITDSASHGEWRVSNFVEIEPNSKVMVTTQQFWGQGLYAFYDKNQNYISGLASNNENARTRLYNKIVSTPSNAKYIVIGFLLESGAFDAPYLFKGIKQNAIPSQIWGGKKWTVIGDSLTANNSRTSMHYFDYIKGFTGIDVVNLGSSGTGYATTSPFYDRVDDVPLDSDVVTMFGSFNDLSTSTPLGTKTDSGTSTIGGCINKAIDDLFTAFPLANLGIITPTPWAGQNEHDGDTQGIAYVQLIKDICYLRGIPCLDLFHESGLRPWDATFRTLAYSKDDGGGTHPDEVGHKIIAPKVEAFLDSLLMH